MPRRLLQPTPLLPLAVLPPLLLLLTVHCAAADRRAFDEATRRSDLSAAAVVREVPRRGQGAAQAYTVAAAAAAGGGRSSEGWAPIRIVVSMENLNDETKYCTAQEDESKPDFEGRTVACESYYILDAGRNKTLVNEVIPVAVQLHAERLLVQRVEGFLKVPAFTAGQGRCQHFKVPDEHKTTGVENADMLLYVAAGASSKTWAVPCAFGTDGRPLAGALHVSPFQRLSVMHSARAAAHAIAHALGFSVEQMTARGMLEDVTNLRGNPNPVTVVKSPATLKNAKAHYGCPDIQGMELLKMNGDAERAYWSPRNAKDELMSLFGGLTAGYYTALTMAMFEDLGYYKAVWGMEEPMAWGRGAGCDFLEKPCSDKSPTEHPGMFCNKKTNDKTLRCTSNRQAIGLCNTNIAEFGGARNEKCSVFWPDWVPSELFCTLKGANNPPPPGSLHGSGSWCLDAEELKLKSPGENAQWRNYKLHAVCAEVQCGEDGAVKVKYLGNEAWHTCNEDSVIEVKPNEHLLGGKIKCPKYEEVCTIAANGSSLVRLSVVEERMPPVLGPPRAGASSTAAGGDPPSPMAAAAGAAAAAPDVPAPPTPAPAAAASVNISAVREKLDGAAQQLGSDAGAAAAAVGCSRFVLLAVATAAAAGAMLPP
ncbi:surface protease GP63 [Trypanosoma conorhini]|uniref:Leishmanolysin-like peptidase n=1 Tax=Trypanosoma conorhini TaxID=83891 RepID=A0A3R7RB68_9TRYP|nr:surface protease GP63 [Trypanosoma conorhini]RNE99178.1 surface protease GP63 [Trypanosoma conorhini]